MDRSISYFDAFSSREPVSTSLENAIVMAEAFSNACFARSNAAARP
jgi:hypothetical protein